MTDNDTKRSDKNGEIRITLVYQPITSNLSAHQSSVNISSHDYTALTREALLDALRSASHPPKEAGPSDSEKSGT